MDTINFKNQFQMMKNIKRFSAITLLGLVFLVIGACNEDSEEFTISATAKAPVLAELNFTKLELDGNNTANPALTLNWGETDYGVQTVINYNIQFSKDDTFSNPSIAAVASGNTFSTLSMSELNTFAGNAGLNPFKWSDIYVRVVASLGDDNSSEVPSNAIKFSIYTYFNYVFDDYYLVGNGLAPGWENNNGNPPLFRNSSDSNVFHYTGLIKNDAGDYNEGRFKVLESKGMWQPQWGDSRGEGSDDFTQSGDIAGNPGTQSSDPGRFGVAATGYYSFEINFSTNKYTLVPFDATGITSPASLTLKGSSTADVTMTPLAFDGHIWYATSVKLTPGEVEFVTGAGAKWGSTSSFSGVATDGGGAIPVIVEDDYDVWFNDLTGRYILIPLNL